MLRSSWVYYVPLFWMILKQEGFEDQPQNAKASFGMRVWQRNGDREQINCHEVIFLERENDHHQLKLSPPIASITKYHQTDGKAFFDL